MYEVEVNGCWVKVTHDIFRSWSGRRRKNGKPYRGKRYYFLSNTVYEGATCD